MSTDTVGSRALDAGLEIIEGLTDDRIQEVHMEFELMEEDTDIGNMRVLDIRHSDEGLSQPYQMGFTLVGEGNLPDLLGKKACLRWTRPSGGMQPDQSREVYGILSAQSSGEGSELETIEHLTLEPALAALGHRVDTRIFQNMSALDVAIEVLNNGLIWFDRTVKSLVPAERCPTREYIVQYRETDLAFVQRLLAEEGILYYFENVDGAEQVVLMADDVTDGEGSTDFVPFREDDSTFTLAFESPQHPITEAAMSLRGRRLLGPNGVHVRQFSWGNPRVQETSIEGEWLRQVYEHGDVAENHHGQDRPTHPVEKQAALRLEASAVSGVKLAGSTTYSQLRPATTFEVSGHSESKLNGTYKVTSVKHSVTARRHGGTSDAKGDYSNEFEAIPVDVPFRPARRAKPRIYSNQTALVIGKDGKTELPHEKGGSNVEDIATDNYGRVRVRFAWDRSTDDDDQQQIKGKVTQSAWLRVGQLWAGAGWGTQFIPRIGMEAVVTFLDGDPDRPLVVGTVYNGATPLPFEDRPNPLNCSGIRTSSTPFSQGGGYNELRLDDTANRELVHLHAQRDLDEKVLRNHSTQVNGSQTNAVGGNQTETVKHDQKLTVDENRKKTVKGKETRTIGERETTVEEMDSVTVKNAHYVVQEDDLIEVAGSRNERYGDSCQVSATNKFLVEQGQSAMELAGGNVKINSKGDIEVANSMGSVTLTKDGTITCQTSGVIEVKGSTVRIN